LRILKYSGECSNITMPYEPYEVQMRQKRDHRQTILALLNERHMSFTQLQKATGFSPTGLTKMLDDLKTVGKIEKVNPKSKKSPYKLKGRGTRLREVFFPGPKIYEVRDRGGKYYFDLAEHIRSDIFNYEPLFGIQSHFLFDRVIGKTYRPLWKKDFFEIEKFIFDKIFKKYNQGGLQIKDKIIGKLFLIFEIDYDKLARIIKSRTEEENDELAKAKLAELKLNP